MTAPAIAAPTCPKCGGGMWDQKNGKFPWKPGTPIFKCKTKECATNGGVIWEPKIGLPANAAPLQRLPIPAHANVPNKDLPEFLRDAETEDTASLAAKVGVDLTGIQSKLAIYQGITEWYLKTIPPIYEKAKIGCSPESAAAGIHTLFITANK